MAEDRTYKYLFRRYVYVCKLNDNVDFRKETMSFDSNRVVLGTKYKRKITSSSWDTKCKYDIVSDCSRDCSDIINYP